MAREFLHALDDMREAITGIENAVADRTLYDYKTDWMLNHAIQRGIEIISEASRALPESVRSLRPEIPWPKSAQSAMCCATNITGFPTPSSGASSPMNCRR